MMLKMNHKLSLLALSGVSLLFGLLLFSTGCKESDPESTAAIGEFSHRMTLTKDRLTSGKYKPEFTPEFILADVDIDLADPRRFYNYSGDLSGRYIEVLSPYCSDGDCSHLTGIVKEVLKHQHSDGRFGDSSLVFTEKQIGKDHMPLLWGNGRLLVGLLEYYDQNSDNEVLTAARRLGDFFVDSYKEVTPEVSKRLEGLGADGIICFTQYVEPLVKLSHVTGDPKYAEVAAKVYPVLPPRGILHSHGYLTTLRGVLDLYEYDKNEEHLKYVINSYTELIASDDYTIYRSVKEYFGGRGDRDEGCSTADFIRLSLHLYKLTGDLSYLERAEHGMYNALFFNQFFTGDYGHHRIDHISSTSEIFNAAWWCCTMSGLRVMQIIQKEYFVENNNGEIKVNLYPDTDYSDDNISLSLSRGAINNDFHVLNIHIDKVNDIRKLMLRRPSWISDAEVYLNDEKLDSKLESGYYSIDNELNRGDVLQFRMKYSINIITPDKKILPVDAIAEAVSGALCYGPYIMAIDNDLDYTFLAEPNNNDIYSNTITNASAVEDMKNITSESFVGDVYLVASYKHGGFPSDFRAVFRPVSEMTFIRHPYMMVTMKFVPEKP